MHVRVRGIGRNPRPELKSIAIRNSGGAERRDTRPAYCFAARQINDFAVYRRDDLYAGDVISGPAAVEEDTTTTIIHGDQRALIDKLGNISIRMKETL